MIRQRQKQNLVRGSSGISLKYATLTHQLITLILAAVAFGYAIWIGLWTKQLAQFEQLAVPLATAQPPQSVSSGSAVPLLYESSYICVGLGAGLMLITAILGCAASLQENSLCLLSFIIVSVLASCLLVIGGSLGFASRIQFESQMGAQFAQAVRSFYGINLQEPRNLQITRAVDAIQIAYKCCGAAGNTNSSQAWSLYRRSSSWYLLNSKLRTDVAPFVPTSCCVRSGAGDAVSNAQICQGALQTVLHPDKSAPRSLPPIRAAEPNPHLNEQGCTTKAFAEYSRITTILVGFGLGVFCFELVGLACACCLLRHMEQTKLQLELEQARLEQTGHTMMISSRALPWRHISLTGGASSAAKQTPPKYPRIDAAQNNLSMPHSVYVTSPHGHHPAQNSEDGDANEEEFSSDEQDERTENSIWKYE